MQRIRRALAPVLLAFAALACAFVVQRALACPIGPLPQPLRTLYQHSDRVVVARVGASQVLQSDGRSQIVRTALHVREDVKGSGERVVNFYHREPVNDEAGRPVVRFHSSRGPAPQYKEGERFLFFLERRQGGEGYVVNDDGYGVKALSDEGLKVYLERIRELAAITSREKEDKAALVEWLVRCAEEPVTRWEGAFELSQSASVAKWESERKAAAEAEKADGKAAEEEVADEEVSDEEGETEGEEGSAEESDGEEESEDEEESGGEETGDEDDEAPATSTDTAAPAPAENGVTSVSLRPSFRVTPVDPSLALLLDGMQKQRLANALFAAQEMGEGESALLDMVKEFGDPRFPDFILMQLRRVENEAPYQATSWLTALANSLGDKELIQLADAYARGLSFQVPPGQEDPADNFEPKEGESDEERMARFRVAVERATQRRSAALKAALSRVELFLAAGAVASK